MRAWVWVVHTHTPSFLLSHMFSGTQFVSSATSFHMCVVQMRETAPAIFPGSPARLGLYLSVIPLSASVSTVGSLRFLGLCHHMIWIPRDKCQELVIPTWLAAEN